MTYSESTYLGSAISSNNQAPFTFTYTDVNEIRVDITVSGTTTTYNSTSNPAGFTITSPEQFVTLSNAPGASDAIRVYRVTDLTEPYAQFTAGSVVSAQALNSNNQQVLQASQESRFGAAAANTTSDAATATADSAVVTANNAVTIANGAVTTANTADTNASAAVVTANTAETNSTNAVNTANTADTNASAAVVTSNTAETNSLAAIATANNADANATTALNNSTEPDGAGGVRSAISVANTALTNSRESDGAGGFNSAIDIANTAAADASNAITAVAAVVDYDPCADVASIPTVTVATFLAVGDSTGIESFTPLTGLPTGFVGAAGLTVRIAYDPTLSTWEWIQYFANDPEDRYFSKVEGNARMPLAGGTFTGNVDFDADATFKGNSTSGSGEIILNCENNSHGVKIKGPPHSAGANYTLTLPNDLGTAGQALKTNGLGSTFFDDVSSSILTQTDFAYAPSSNTVTYVAGSYVASSPTVAGTYNIGSIVNNEFNLIWGVGDNNDTELRKLQVNDTITFEYGANSYSATVIQEARSNSPTTTSWYCKFDSSTFVLNTTDELKITSPRISLGTAPLGDDDVLRYKTATQKWTAVPLVVDARFIETPKILNTDKVIPPNINAGMMGPIVVVPSGITINIGANSRLTMIS